MLRRKITKDYVSGVLEKVGGFATHKNPANQKLYLYFKIVNDDPYIKEIMDFLAKQGIVYKDYVIKGKKVYYITQQPCVEKMIEFIKKNCHRKDYKKYRKTPKGYVKVAV